MENFVENTLLTLMWENVTIIIDFLAIPIIIA